MTVPKFDISEHSGLWLRGGSWSIEWAGSPSSVPSISSSQSHPSGALTYQMSEDSDLVNYDPMTEDPPVYLVFADLGQVVWASFGNRFLAEMTLDPDVPETLKAAAISFITMYGPPVNPGVSGDRAVWEWSLHPMLRQAQLVALAVRYQRVIMGEEDTRSLRDYMRAMDESTQEENQSPTSTPVDRDLDPHDGLLEAAEELIDAIQGGDLALGNLTFVVRRSQAEGGPGNWTFELHFEHLLNVIWYQTFKSIVVRTLIRTCRNPRCDKPGRLFESARPNQWFCGARCRSVHNTWRFRHPADV